MKRACLIFLSALALSACKEDPLSVPQPVDMTSEALGYYCQMDLLVHDGPKGQIHLDGMPSPIFFAQVRDAIAYLLMPEQSHAVKAAYVQDMSGVESWGFPGEWMSLSDAFFVVGSTKRGGMGADEFVPFSDQAAAKVFIASYGGKIQHFDEITAQDVLTTAQPESGVENDADIANRLNALVPTEGMN